MQKQTLEKKIAFSSMDFDDDFPIMCVPCLMGEIDLNTLHFHNFFEIGLCLEGSGLTLIGNTMHRFKKDHIFFLFPNQPHMSQSPMDDLSSWYYLFFDIDRLLCNNPEIRNIIEMEVVKHKSDISNHIHGQQAETLVSLLKTIIIEYEEKNYGYQNIIKHLLISFLFMVAKFTSDKVLEISNAGQYITIAPVLNHINMNYASKITIDDMAKIANVSTGHFRRIFKQTMGCSPLEHLTSVRLNMAKTMLKATSNSMSHICTQVGFENISTFNRYFKRKFGITPTAYRKG